MADTEKVTLGNGALVINGVDVGHLKGIAEFMYTKDAVDFKPANMLGPVKRFYIREGARLRVSAAEVKAANFKLAMGVSTAVASNTSFPAEEGSWSFSVAVGSESYDVLTFGGDKSTVERSLRFTHTRPNGKALHIIFYKAVVAGNFNMPFNEEDVTLYDMEFEALADASRAAGDQVGCVVEEI